MNSNSESIPSLGVSINPPVPPDAPMNAPHGAIVTIQGDGFARLHFHEVPPTGTLTSLCGEMEAYRMVAGGMVVWIREQGEREWRTIRPSLKFPWVFIPPGAAHGVLADDTGVTFVTLTKKAHLVPAEKGGNVHLVPWEDYPPEFQQRIPKPS